jgi:chemotaxis protein MotB
METPMNRTAATINRSIARTGAILAACVLSGSLGCVTSDTYLTMVRHRDALAQEKALLEQENARLAEELSALGASEQELANLLSEQERKVSSLRGTYDRLVNELESELDSGRVEIEQLRNGIRLSVAEEILFESGSAEIDAEGREVLGKVAAQVTSSPNRVEVVGHTDDRPIRARLTSRYPTNWELAGARASSVVRLLQQQGIEGTQLRASSHGEFDPVASNETDDGRARNRRIEIRLLPPAELDAAKRSPAQDSDAQRSAMLPD